MTEPEGFEDDLFADLYNDDDAPKAAPPADQPPAPAAPAAEEAPATTTEANGQQDDYQPAEQDDDDNDVDFDLGETTQPVLSPAPAPQRQDVTESPPPSFAGSAPKPPSSSKEDG